MTSAAVLLRVASIAIGLAFLVIGIRNIRNHALIADLMRSRNIPMPSVSAAGGIAMQAGFGAFLATGLWPLVAASGLAIFVAAATAIAHWPFRGTSAERQENFTACLINTIMLGGLLAVISIALT